MASKQFDKKSAVISTGDVALDNQVPLLDPMDFQFQMPGEISYRITLFISTSRIFMVENSFRDDEDTSHFEGTQASKY